MTSSASGLEIKKRSDAKIKEDTFEVVSIKTLKDNQFEFKANICGNEVIAIHTIEELRDGSLEKALQGVVDELCR